MHANQLNVTHLAIMLLLALLQLAAEPAPWSCSDVCAGQPLLLPLTSSLYVSGTLESADQVLVDVGTGYYVEVRAVACRHDGSHDSGTHSTRHIHLM